MNNGSYSAGDLHDGAGLSDASSPNGLVSNPIFEEVDYDLLTIGNHGQSYCYPTHSIDYLCRYPE